jgi:hypothetical protein
MDNPEILVTLNTQETGNTVGRINVRKYPRDYQDGQPRDIGSIGHTRHRTKTNKAYKTTQHRKLKMSILTQAKPATGSMGSRRVTSSCLF